MITIPLFWAMMKEEWRVHSTLFGGISFALFPVCIFGIAFMGAFLAPLLPSVMPAGIIALLVHGLYFLLGIMAGGFGLLGREIMNRRFGEAGLIAPAARYLPLSDRAIFGVFVLKDTVYYLILWVLPFLAGLALAAPFVPMPGGPVTVLFMTIPLAFLSGLALVFLLTTLYARSPRLTLLAGAAILILAAVLVTLPGERMTLPHIISFLQADPVLSMVTALAVIGGAFTISLAYPVTEWQQRVVRYPERYTSLLGWFSWSRSGPLLAKDLLELLRNGGLAGQTVFSLILPLVLIRLALALLSTALPADLLFFLFAATAGVIASTIYTWITEFDSLPPYALLPLDLPALLRSKTTIFHALLVIPACILLITGLLGGDWLTIIPAIITMAGIASYLQVVMVLLAGLRPSIMIYDARVLVMSALLSTPAVGLVIATGLQAGPLAGAVVALLLIPVAAWFFHIAIGRAGRPGTSIT